uniref:DUF4132 domain-containing protein n=1 Tax=Thaumasiovibrio occultus TaxID=1891184 RepID=UPI000B360994|nr:DUF4132 domain-containing protein [Thaumasiovibrio occultus]
MSYSSVGIVYDDSVCEAEETLATAFTVFKEYWPDLDKEIAGFVLTGEGEGCLRKIKTLTDEQKTATGRAHPRFWLAQLPQVYRDSAKAIAIAFNEFLSSDSMYDAAIVQRLISVLEAAAVPRHFEAFSHVADPTRLEILFCHLHSASCGIGDDPERQFPHISLAWFKSLAELERVNEAQLYYCLFDGYYQGGSTFWDRLYRRNKQSRIDDVGWLETFTTPTFLREILPTLNARQKTPITEIAAQYTDLSPLTELLVTLACDKDNAVKKTALSLLVRVDNTALSTYLAQNYTDWGHHKRRKAIDLAKHLENGRELIAQWAKTEKTPSVVNALHLALNGPQRKTEPKLPTYTSLTSTVTLPATFRADFSQALDQLLATLDAEESQKTKHTAVKAQKLREISSECIETTFGYLETGQGKPNAHVLALLSELKLSNEFSFTHLLRYEIGIDAQSPHNHIGYLFDDPQLCHALQAQTEIVDLRQLYDVVKQEGQPPADNPIIRALLVGNSARLAEDLPKAFRHLAIWPLLATYPEVLDSALLNVTYLHRPLYLLKHFPYLPSRYHEILYQHALSDVNGLRPIAQSVLAHFGIDTPYLISFLSSKKGEQRIQAAQWLAELNCREAISALVKAVEKEKQQLTRAELLSALGHLGGDISRFFTSEHLVKEAKIGLKKSPPTSMAWFPLNAIPALQFSDGTKVPPEIPRWWVILAVKLKSPAGNILLQQYFSLLSQESQQTLSRFVFNAFVTFDTQCPSDDDAHHYAEQHKHATFQMVQSLVVGSPNNSFYTTFTLEDAYQISFKERKAQYLNSAIKDKGLLCLMNGMPATEALNLISHYMKTHPRKHRHVEAMLESLSTRTENSVIQFILSIARRYKQSSVQDKARLLVKDIAKNNQWSAQQLGDRTIPACGFDGLNPTSAFEYGQRSLSLKLSDSLKIVVQSEQGKELKALPQPRQGDNDSDIREAKNRFNSFKKELRLVAKQQPLRLAEAMSTNRMWSATEWFDYFYQHPVMNRLLQRVVWSAKINDQWQAFRPAEDGAFLSIDDDELDLTAAEQIQIATLTTLTKPECQLWKTHFREYKVKPLLEQFGAPDLDITKLPAGATQIDHYRGLLCDTFTLRNTLAKLGYTRGAPQHRGIFYDYFKEFTESGYRISFEFSGSSLPEENVTAAIYHVAVNEIGKRQYGESVPLSALPQSLVAMMAMDYEKVAAKCTKDHEWESKLQWQM